MSKALTKADILDSVTEETGFLRKRSIETVETLLEIIKRTLESGEDILISGFGKFCIKDKDKRRGRNIRHQLREYFSWMGRAQLENLHIRAFHGYSSFALIRKRWVKFTSGLLMISIYLKINLL